MSRVRFINPLEDPSWDTRIAQKDAATCFHTSAWCRSLVEAYGYSPRYGVGENGEPLLPLMEVDSWLTGRRGISLPFTDAVEPFSRDAQLDESIRSHAAERKWKYIEYRTASFARPGEQPSTLFEGHTLELVADEAAQFAACDSATRRAVRKAQQGEIAVEFSTSREAMETFTRLLAITRRRHGVPVQPTAFFSGIQRNVLAQNLGCVALARHRDECVAGAVFLHFGRNVTFKFGASDERFQALRANNLVMWEAIRRYAREGYKTLDFGRTSIGNDGLSRFKLGWGAKRTEIAYFRVDLPSGKPIAAPDRSTGWHAPIFRRIPVFLSRLIGALIYRHIA